MENKIHRTSHYCDDVVHIYVFWCIYFMQLHSFILPCSLLMCLCCFPLTDVYIYLQLWPMYLMLFPVN